MLFKLSRCITYWSYMLLARRKKIHWDIDSAPRFGIKPEMKYTPKRFLMSIDTVIKGNVYNWKADFQGDTNFPIKLEDYDSYKDFLSGVLGRIDSYHEKMKQKFDAHERRQANQGRYQQNRSLNPAEKNLKETLNILKQAIGDAVEKLHRNPNELEKYRENTLKSQLGRKFHGTKHNNDAQVYNEDGDVTYNTKKKMYFSVEGKCNIDINETTEIREYQIELVKHFPYRRNRGVHMDTENEHTIKWINSVLPHVSKGWFEIIISIAKDDVYLNYKIQLTPWERRNTTFVRPFVLVAEESPVHSEGHLISSDRLGFDFREEEYANYKVYKPEPFIIHGKGTEIDAIIHSLRALCLIDERHLNGKVEKDIEWLYEQIKTDPDNNAKILANESIMKYMRAYFSSDAKTGIVGDKSVFFFNIQGVIAGVEMYAPSLPPYVDLQGRSGGYGIIPKRPRQPHNAWNIPVFHPPAPQHQIIQSIPPEIQQLIQKANQKMEDVEKYMKDHKEELPAQIERIVKEATKDLHAARGAIENQSQQQNAWDRKPRFDPFKQNPNAAQQNVHAHEQEKPKNTSAMTHDERKVHDEKERQKKIREDAVRLEREKAEKEKYRRNDPKHGDILNLSPNDLALIDGERINFKDFPSKVEGHYNEMYQLQLYPPYRNGVPNVDVSGLVPGGIKIEIKISDEDYEKTYNGVLQCLDSTVPVFGGNVRIGSIKDNMTETIQECYLIVTRHVLKNSSGINTDVVWGMKCKLLGNKSYIYENCELIAHKKTAAEQFLIGGAQRHNWNFTHSLDMIRLSRHADVEVVIENLGINKKGIERYIRGANATIENVPERKRMEANDEYQQMNIEDLKQKELYGLSPFNLEKYNRRQEMLKMNNRVNKIVLYTFSQDYMKKLISGNDNLKKSVTIFSCPKFLKMTSFWLNENPKLDPSVSDPANSNMYLVDTQGPVYVSENGRFMVSPYIADNGTVQVATWGIFIWNSNIAKYETFAYKLSGRQSLFLINDPDNCLNNKDLELGRGAENYWIQFFRFDGSPIGEHEVKETQVINFFLTEYDGTRPENPYHMFPRFPDYTISLAEHNIINFQREKKGQLPTDNKFEEHTTFHEANMLALEAFTEHHLNTKKQNSNPGLGPLLPPNVTPNFTFRRHTSASTTMPVRRIPRKFYEPQHNLQTYRTYRLEAGVLDYNPWEFALHKVLLHVNRFLHERKEQLGDDEEFEKFLQEEEEKIKETKISRPPVAQSKVKRSDFRNASFRPNGRNGKPGTRAEYSDDADDYLLRQCFDDPPASQRLPAQPRKLAAPVRTFAPWKPPAAGVSW